MNIPDRYIRVFDGMPVREVTIGCGRIELFDLSTLAAKQIGYAVGPDGTSLTGDSDGDWRSEWLVIGQDTGTGDPIILNRNKDQLPVLTSMIGSGDWNSEVIATSVEALGGCFNELPLLSINREDVVKHQDNPVTESERAVYLARVAGHSDTSEAPAFWDAFLAY